MSASIPLDAHVWELAGPPGAENSPAPTCHRWTNSALRWKVFAQADTARLRFLLCKGGQEKGKEMAMSTGSSQSLESPRRISVVQWVTPLPPLPFWASVCPPLQAPPGHTRV